MDNKRKKFCMNAMLILFVILMFTNVNWKHYAIMSGSCFVILCLLRYRSYLILDDPDAKEYNLKKLRDDIIVSLCPVINGLVGLFMFFTLLTKRETFIRMMK